MKPFKINSQKLPVLNRNLGILLTIFTLGVLNGYSQCTITDVPLTAAPTTLACGSSANIQINPSQSNIGYLLRHNSNDSIIGIPVFGNGGVLTFPTGNLTQTTTYNVLAASLATALQFDGIDDQVIIGNNPLLNISSSITIESWIRPTKTGGGAQSVLSKSSNVQNSGYIFPRSDDDWNNFIAYLYIGSSWKTISAPYPSLNSWHHVAVTYDGAMIRLYLDGVQVNSTPASGAIVTNANSLVFGNQPGYSEYYGGNVDDTRIWNVARSQQDIRANMSGCVTGNPTGLVANYRMENGAGSSTLTDLTGNGNTGTLVNMNSASCWVNGTSVCSSCSQELSQTFTVTVVPLTGYSLNVADYAAVCWSDTTVTLASSQSGVNYYLRNSATNAIIDGPKTGNGIPLVFNTGVINATTAYHVYGANSSGCEVTSLTNFTVTINPIGNKPVTIANPDLCAVNTGTSVTLSNSELGVEYMLRDNSNDTIVSGPLSGTGGNLVFNTGTLSSDMAYNIYSTVTGQTAGGALRFSDSDDKVLLTNPNQPIINASTPFTIELWYYRESSALAATLIAKESSSPGAYQLRMTSVFRFTLSGDFGGLIHVSHPGIVFDSWQHVAITYDGSMNANGIKFYFNGVQGTSANIVSNTIMSGTQINTSNTVIGNNSAGSSSMIGSLSELRFWNTERSAAEIAANYTGCLTGNDLELQALYTFDDGPGSTILTDHSANGWNGALTNMNPSTAWETDTLECTEELCSAEMSTTVSVTVHPAIDTLLTTTICNNESILVNGTTYNASNPAGTEIIQVQRGTIQCDSVITVNLNVLPFSGSSETINACDSYTWNTNGTTYTTSGTYTASVQNSVGCDSILTLNLTIVTIIPEVVSVSNSTLCPGNGGTTVSISSSEVGVNYALYDAIEDTLIAGPIIGTGAGLVFNTGAISSNMTYKVIGQNPTNAIGTSVQFDGVDDFLEETQGMIPYIPTYGYLEAWIYLESYGDGSTIIEKPNGFHFYLDSVGNMHFANSIAFGAWDEKFATNGIPVPLNQWVNVGVYNDVNAVFYMNGMVVGISDTVAATSSTFGDPTIGGINSGNVKGGMFDGKIDEIAIWDQFIAPSPLEDLSCIQSNSGDLLYFCNFENGSTNYVIGSAFGLNDTLFMNGMTAATAFQSGIECGTCFDEMQNQVTVTFGAPTTSSAAITACDSYSWNGTTYLATGVYTYSTTNAAGCDSTATLNLTINGSSTSSTTIAACYFYLWNGVTYTTSGVYTWASTNALGCDSTATLNLTINNSSTSSTTQTACDSYTWNGTNYTTSGVYTYSTMNSVGCDSTVTLNLTINTSSTSSTTLTACDSYTWNGTNYTTSGVYTYSTMNSVGCDSTVTLNLTINNSSTSSTTQTACDSYSWNGTTYTTSGVYTYSTTNSVGCDSTATLNLTINSVDVTTSVSEVTISATNTAANSYQWIDCANGDAPINGATSFQYTATVNGNYAVILTEGSCSDTSACVIITNVGIDPLELNWNVQIYPNPTSGQFTISSSAIGATCELLTIDGKVIQTLKLEQSEVLIDSHIAPGAYVVRISQNGAQHLSKILVL